MVQKGRILKAGNETNYVINKMNMERKKANRQKPRKIHKGKKH